MSHFNPIGHYNAPDDEDALRQIARAAFSSFCKDQPQGSSRHAIAVEIGSWAGRTTLILADCGFRVFAVDTWQGNPEDHLGQIASSLGEERILDVFCQNLQERLFQSVFPLVDSSCDWALRWPSEAKIDLLFLDGDHRYQSVRQDIDLWTPFVASGGTICGHDYNFPSVKQAVDETGPCQVVGKSVWVRKNV